ncbi:MAG: glycosyltransferase family 4 protein [Planctomycetes bacterium]|nr:glycosyltransferase family 4 protein [Planctomycetota bacterium]
MRTLAVVTNIPTPYRVPLFNTLAEALPEVGWRLHVLFGSQGNARRRWDVSEQGFAFPCEFLGGWNLRLGTERILNTYGGLGDALRRIRPGGIVCTGYSAGTVAASRYARKHGIPLAIWSGTVPGPLEREWWRVLLRRWLVRKSDGFLAYGSAAREYLVSLGADPGRIHIAWNTVETDRFLKLPLPRSPLPSEPLRLLTVGYLERRKRVDLAIEAVAAAARRGSDVELEVAGDGTERAALEALAADLGVAGRVRFLGNVAYDAIPALHGRAHGFLFPTEHDIWGLALVEAMAAGKACVASVRAGATRDLVTDGVTGYAVDFERTEAVARRLAAMRERVEELGAAARARVQSGFTLAKSGEGWQELVSGW